MSDKYIEICVNCENDTFKILTEVHDVHTTTFKLICTKCELEHSMWPTGGYDGYTDIDMNTKPKYYCEPQPEET